LDVVRPPAPAFSRRSALRLAGAGAATLLLAACGAAPAWHSTDLTGTLPDLGFTMTRASDGKEVTAADYRGKIVLLYFGYTFCPDVCPTTLLNITQIMKNLGPLADKVRVLFVTVDPNRDTPKVLQQYVSAFAPQTVGLRGTPDQLASIAKRYRVVYSVSPAHDGKPYEVTHSSAVYAFDGAGKIRLLISGLSTTTPPIAGATADLKRLIEQSEPPGWFARLWQMI
jgi:protein SCO1/2